LLKYLFKNQIPPGLPALGMVEFNQGNYIKNKFEFKIIGDFPF
jgi:hypothetical protein